MSSGPRRNRQAPENIEAPSTRRRPLALSKPPAFGRTKVRLYGAAAMKKAGHHTRPRGLRCTSERNSYTKLNHTRIVSRSHLSESAAGKVGVRLLELGVIEEVEEFSAQLQCDTIVDGRRFGQRHVDIGAARSAQNVPARAVASCDDGISGGISRGRTKAAGTEVIVAG